jgi:hypothetical protein
MKKYLVLILLAFIGFTSYSQTSNDADAQAFILACDADPAGKLTPDQKNYITQMVEGMKSIGVWDGMKAVYPMVGNTAFKNKFNLKDPRDLNAAFRLVFFNNPIHNATGVVWNGSNQYANTFLTPSISLSATSTHISYYTPTNSISGIQIPMGAASSSGGTRNFQLNLTSANYNSGGPTSLTIYTPTTTNGYTLGTRTSINAQAVFYKGDKIATNTFNGDNSLSLVPLFIGVRNNDSTPGFYSTHTASFASIGAGLTDNQAQRLSHLIYYLQGILNRQ